MPDVPPTNTATRPGGRVLRVALWARTVERDTIFVDGREVLGW